jgi:hypothetical protein
MRRWPVEVDNLDSLVASRPAGAVATKLDWSAVDDDGFERLIFNLLADAAGYTNPLWLMKTRAADRGRDLSVERALVDPLSGTTHQRVIVQCKHTQAKSIGPVEASEAATKAELWEPPFDALIMATSGRFTADAVAWIEQHNRKKRLSIEMWPDSQLELLLASRPYLVEEFKLRPPSA